GMARTTLKCSPTTSIQQEARLVLMSKRDGGGAHAATLVFLLRSLVNTRAPLKRVRAEGPVYEMQQFEVVVTNPFMQDCEFSIQLLHEPAEPLPVKEPEESNKKGPKRKAAPPAAELSSQAAALKAKMFPAAFALDRSRLRLKQNGSEKVRVSFLPFWIGTHYCTLLLRDKDAGSFAYELVGEAGLPAPCLEAKGVVPLESAHHTFDLFIPWLNPPLEAAKRTFLERHPGAKDRDQVELLKRDPFKTLGEAEYSVSQTNSLVSCSDRLVLSPSAIMPLAVEKGGPQPGKLGEPLGPGVLRLALKPLGTGIYPARVLLTSTAHYDVRVVDLELTAQTMVQQFELQFECAVRQSIMQEVPLVNTSDQFMAVSATLSSSTKAFAGQREVSVPPGATVAYPLQFRPLTVGAHEGLLELSIPSTGEKNQYRLQGKALDPVAESHVIVECQARKPATKTIV
ncbi:calponin-homology (CH) domain-containing protein, partial [Haematococcus lacustris]